MTNDPFLLGLGLVLIGAIGVAMVCSALAAMLGHEETAKHLMTLTLAIGMMLLAGFGVFAVSYGLSLLAAAG